MTSEVRAIIIIRGYRTAILLCAHQHDAIEYCPPSTWCNEHIVVAYVCLASRQGTKFMTCFGGATVAFVRYQV